jgi:hypothetical protein
MSSLRIALALLRDFSLTQLKSAQAKRGLWTRGAYAQIVQEILDAK